MNATTTKQILLTTLLAGFASGILSAQNVAPFAPPIGYDEVDAVFASEAPYVIFSNLDGTPDARYNSDSFPAISIAGKNVFAHTEKWVAVAFTPKVDVQAKVLLAGIGQISGTSIVNLGIYEDDRFSGSVGDRVPGGQGSTTEIPDLGECCQLVRVTLPGEGVTLQAKTRYWLVASPDNSNAPDFEGAWHVSNQARYASFYPTIGTRWGISPGVWPAAQIRGTRSAATQSSRRGDLEVKAQEEIDTTSNGIIFSSLDRLSPEPYFPGNGLPLIGSDVPNQPVEAWQALPFTPKTDVHATTVAAAIALVSGTRLINLGIYDDRDGNVGTPLPGGQGSTTDIPDSGDCCELARVKLPGVALAAGVQYWLVATTDDANAPDFHGVWQASRALGAYQQPELLQGWSNFNGNLLAAEIRGTNP